MAEPSKSIYLNGPYWLHWGLVWDTFWGLFGFHLGSFWGPCGVRLGVQERLQHKTLFGPPSDLPRKALGPPLGPQVGPMLEALERLGALLGALGAILGPSGTDF